MKIASSFPQRVIALPLTATLLHAGLAKVRAGEVPEWFLKSFAGTLLDAFPGALHAQFILITLAEVAIGLLGFSLVLFPRGERLRRRIDFTYLGACLLFVALGFGLRLTGKFADAATLYFYAVTSLALRHLLLV